MTFRNPASGSVSIIKYHKSAALTINAPAGDIFGSSIYDIRAICAGSVSDNQVIASQIFGGMRELQPISYSLLVAFCYRHLPPPDRNGARPPDHDSAAASGGRAAAALQSSQEWGSGCQGEY